MTFTREVCKAFFNFESVLNKIDAVIPALYEHILQTKRKNSNLFYTLDQIIAREAYTCQSVNQFVALLKISWVNVDIFPRSRWTSIAYIFYVTDYIDGIARQSLNKEAYHKFKETAESSIADYLEFKYGKTLSKYAWEVFCVSVNCNAICETKDFTDITKIIFWATATYCVTKYFW